MGASGRSVRFRFQLGARVFTLAGGRSGVVVGRHEGQGVPQYEVEFPAEKVPFVVRTPGEADQYRETLAFAVPILYLERALGLTRPSRPSWDLSTVKY